MSEEAMDGLAERIEKLAGHVCDPLDAGAFTGEYQALLRELRSGMEAGLIQPEECARLTLQLRHLCVGRMAFLVTLRLRAAAEVAAKN